MAARGSILGRKQEDAIAALLTQRNVEEAARAAGIGVRTLLRWLQLPEFQAAYRQARREAFGQAVARLQQGTSAAATTLLKTMIDPATPASVRVRAAEAIFNHAAKAIEIEDIEARVAELERTSGGLEARAHLGESVTDESRTTLPLERLEVRVEPKKPQLFRSGYLKTLPADYVGERHVVIVKREPTGAPETRMLRPEECPAPRQ